MDSPLLATAAIILDNEKVLLVRRNKEPYKDFWCFVGGYGSFMHVSDPIKAIKMEVKFDLDCEFEPIFFKYSHSILEAPIITLFFYGKINGIPKITREHIKEYKWFDLNEASNIKLGFDNSLILNDFLSSPVVNKI